MPNGKEDLTNWQISLIKFTYWFGVPALLAVYLVWYGTRVVDNKLVMMQRSLDSCTSHTIAYGNQFLEFHGQLANQDKKFIILQNALVRICINTAKNSNERIACFAAIGSSTEID